MYEFRLRFHWNLFPRVQLTIFHHWFRQWLGAGQVTSHYLNQWWLIYWRIYASLGLNGSSVFWSHHQHQYPYHTEDDFCSFDTPKGHTRQLLLPESSLRLTRLCIANSSSPAQNGRPFASAIFKHIFMSEKFCILIRISLKFVHNGPIDNIQMNGSDDGLAPTRRQAIIWTNADRFHWCIYAAPGTDELIRQGNQC